jgi:hypothetical protein
VLSLLMTPCCSELFVSVRRHDSSVYLLRFVGRDGTESAHSFELASSRLIVRNDCGSSLVVLPIMGHGGGIMIRHARGLSIVSRDLLQNIATGTQPLSALRIATASASGDDEICPSPGSFCCFGAGSACLSPGGFLVILTTGNLSCAVVSALHCVTPHPISAVMRYCIAASLARTRSVADAMIAFSTLVALLPKVLSVPGRIQEWVFALSRNFVSVSRDKEAQRLIQGHIIHMMCQGDFFSMKSRQHINLSHCQRVELLLKHWKDAGLGFVSAVPDATPQHSLAPSLPTVCAREWLLLMMLRFVAMHHVLRYMTACLDANYQEIRSSRESPDGHQRLLKLKQCMDTLKNVTSIPSVELYGFLIAYKPILSELAALHAESKSDAISHPALASLHRDVAELLAEALDLTAKSVAQPSNLHSEFQALVRRKMRLRSMASSSTTNASPAATCTPSGSKSAPDAPAAAAAPAATEQEGGNRAMSSPPPHSATAAAGSGIRDDSPEFASVFLRYAACASWGKGPGGCFVSQLW